VRPVPHAREDAETEDHGEHLVRLSESTPIPSKGPDQLGVHTGVLVPGSLGK
jgi:hypothetical protein